MVSIEGYVQFNDLNLNKIDTNSGVFFGNNNANNWSSTKKNNQGFGQASGCEIREMINILFDNDEVDTFITQISEEQINDTTPVSSKQVNQLINLKDINVNSLQFNSGINIGETLSNNWRTHNKNNRGFGSGAGINMISDMINSVEDHDIYDNIITDANCVKNVQDNKSPS